MTDEEHRKRTQKLGQAVVSDGRLAQVAARLQFSANIMAELLDVAPTTYRRWMESVDVHLWPNIAERVGTFYRAAVGMIGELSQEGTIIDEYVPLHKVAQTLGWPNELLLARIRAGAVLAEDFDVLGLWVPVSEVERLQVRGKRVAA